MPKAGVGVGLAGVISIVGVVVVILAALWPGRPLIDHTIGTPNVTQAPSQLNFASGGVQLSFFVRNRGDDDAPVFVNITVVNAYISLNSEGPFNQSTILFYSVLEAHSKEYSGWSYYIMPVKDARLIQIKFSITKNWRTEISGISNWFFGEYNAWGTDMTYVENPDQPKDYVLKS